MSRRLTNLAVIPARAGSKRFPGKNWHPLKGKPLIAYTLEAAIDSQSFTEIVVSTDSDAVRKITASYPTVSLDARPPQLASDTATVIDVTLELMGRYANSNLFFDLVTVLLPTYPFRTARNIQESAALMEVETVVDAVVAVSLFRVPPQFSIELDNQSMLKPAWPASPLLVGQTRIQDQTPLFFPNGCLYVSRWHKLLENRSFFMGRVRGVVVERESSVDIDDAADFRYAEYLAREIL